MRLEQIARGGRETTKAKYFTVHLQKDDIHPPDRELLDFARSSTTFGFLTKRTASAFTEQVRETYAESIDGQTNTGR